MAGRSLRGGRPGSADEARELVALVSSLSEAGDSLDPEAVATRLGVTRERAEKLVELVLTSRVAGGTGLPLVEEDGVLTMARSSGLRGRRLRLSHGETLALAAALERLGVPADDPLRARLEDALGADPVDETLVRRFVGAAGQSGHAPTLITCARAMAARHEVLFSYKKVGSELVEERRAVPLALRESGGSWLLDAWDLEREGERTFRVDRMSEAREGATAHRPDKAGERARAGGRTVRVTFLEPALLDLLPWHDLSVVERRDDGTVGAETPWYGGTWLVRMLAACGSGARTDDEELAARVRAYAAGLLAR